MKKCVKNIRAYTMAISLLIILYSIIFSQKYNIRLYNDCVSSVKLILIFIFSILITGLADYFIYKKYYLIVASSFITVKKQYIQTVLLFSTTYLFFFAMTFLNTISYEYDVEVKMGYGLISLIIVIVNLAVATILLPYNVIMLIVTKVKKTNKPIFLLVVNIVLCIVNFLLSASFFILSFVEAFQFK